jgi:hypothetical protein
MDCVSATASGQGPEVEAPTDVERRAVDACRELFGVVGSGPDDPFWSLHGDVCRQYLAGGGPSVIVEASNRRNMFLVTRLLPRAVGVREIGKHALKNFLDGVRP